MSDKLPKGWVTARISEIAETRSRPPARSGCVLSLREILFTRSQRAQIAGQLVPQGLTDEPAEELLERIQKEKCVA